MFYIVVPIDLEREYHQGNMFAYICSVFSLPFTHIIASFFQYGGAGDNTLVSMLAIVMCCCVICVGLTLFLSGAHLTAFIKYIICFQEEQSAQTK